MNPTCSLEKDEVRNKVYRGMIGSLLYLTSSRPDSLFSDYLCAHFQSYPRESHLTTVKRIFRYLKGTTNLGLCYKKYKEYNLVGYYDAGYARDRLERKITSKIFHFLGYNLISWSSKRQSTITPSTTEAEYIAASRCNTQIL